jgi:hypothetical protein
LEFQLESDRYDAALCLGATFIWGGLPGTLDALTPAVRRGGFVAVGEPYWRKWPPPEEFEAEFEEGFVTLPATVKRLESAGLHPLALIDSSWTIGVATRRSTGSPPRSGCARTPMTPTRRRSAP